MDKDVAKIKKLKDENDSLRKKVALKEKITNKVKIKAKSATDAADSSNRMTMGWETQVISLRGKINQLKSLTICP